MAVVVTTTVVLLMLSNIFMTFAWYAHLRNLNDRPRYLAAMFSWGMRQPFTADYLWAAFCMMGTVYFVFRS